MQTLKINSDLKKMPRRTLIALMLLTCSVVVDVVVVRMWLTEMFPT